jgi:OPA family glycerol-3-phosphate transporter-like MFS transporter 1/2
MFFAGHLGDRVDLRLFLTAGMVCSGLFVALFGMGFFWDVHEYSYYIFISILAGLFQSTGWPSVVSIVANWFGKGKRGLVMGIWNAHTSVGNILGAVIASSFLSWVRYGLIDPAIDDP